MIEVYFHGLYNTYVEYPKIAGSRGFQTTMIPAVLWQKYQDALAAIPTIEAEIKAYQND